MGSDDPQFPDARPWHRVWVDGFHMDKTLVTNAEYAAFVHATGYVTVAEQIPNAKDYPGAPAEKLVAGSIVFAPPAKAVPLNNQYQWWDFVKGANWRHPEGTKSDLRGRLNHPVVQVAYDDGIAYYSWAGGRLPTEAEFEYAARGGMERKRYAWGDEFRPGGTWPTPFKATFRRTTPPRTPMPVLLRWDLFQRTATAFMTWLATSGNGHRTGTVRTTTRLWQPRGKWRKIRLDHPTVSIQASPEFPSACSEADPTCAPTSIAVATASARMVEGQPTPAQTTWVFVAYITERHQLHGSGLTQVLGN